MFLDDEQMAVQIRNRQTKGRYIVALTVVLACLVTTLATVGTAAASEMPQLSEILTPQLLLSPPASDSTQLVFGGFIAVCSVAAAGLWRLSFRAPATRREFSNSNS